MADPSSWLSSKLSFRRTWCERNEIVVQRESSSAKQANAQTPLIGGEWLGRLSVLEGLADNHQNWTEALLNEVRALPRVIQEMTASAQAEIDRQLAIEREGQQRTFRHLREEVVACDAELDRVGMRLDEARATVARLANRLDRELEGASPAPAAPTTAGSSATATPPAMPPSTGPASAAPDARTDDTDGNDEQRRITLSVRGARRATLGLSIREHLQRLPYIEDVALSNYAENVLCLEIVAQRRILLEDALTWEQIPGVRIISVRPDEIEAEIEEFMSAGTPLAYVNVPAARASESS